MKKTDEETTTKEKILQATLDVIEERAISGTRMRCIAEKAHVYQSNLHYYYKSKKELLLAVQKKVADRCVELRSINRTNAEQSFEEQLDIFILQKLTFIKEEPKYDYAEMDFWVQARFDPDIKAEFKRSFYGWRRELNQLLDTYCPSMTSQNKILLSSVIISLLEGASIQYLIDSDAFSVDHYFELCKKIIIRETIEISKN